MKRDGWIRYLVAAIVVLLAGAVWALAEETEMKVEVRSENGQEMTLDVNGVTEVIKLDDLAEGEERTYDVGGHEITVKRINDRLSLVHEGTMMDCLHGEHGGRRVVVMKRGDGTDIDVDTDLLFVGEGDTSTNGCFIVKGTHGEIDIEALEEKCGEGVEEFYTADGARVLKWVSEEGDDHPIIIERIGPHGEGDYVTYRCQETGSMLTVKADENLLDDYIDPATGCVMKKVEHAGVHVIKIREKIIDMGDEH